ncbi:aminotransferase [Thalassotalea insulae]|uniref:Aminotransferase n=1 Tax=Thalassotalea insulae TaxID=2056778 RepID=A0ABQ6GYG6_9GAMM|nr:aminotransferase class I/II-fold pyridoxal phosphate-dependent enzyme [Thalassotalea insulae]GLX79251.1 aminotransferase [Thalassotalea insulae]
MTINQPALPKHLAFVQRLSTPVSDSLSNSCGQALSLDELAELTEQDFSALNEIKLSYASLRGSERLREQIAYFHQALNHHQFQLTAEHVLTFCGAQEALAALYQLLLQPGDEVVVVTPNYPSLSQMAEQAGCVVKAIALSPDRAWQLTLADFQQVVNHKTKLILINSPHNPSGQVIDSKLADDILLIAQQYNCYLIADDVSQATNYYQLNLSHRFLDYQKAVVVSVMSKSFGLAGIRLGWVLSRNKELLNRLLALKSYSSICCSLLDETVATMVLSKADKIIASNNQIVKNNIVLFEQLVSQLPEKLAWCPPQAGILALVEVKGIDNIESWAQALAQTTGILALPGTLFGLIGPYFRLGLGQKEFAPLLARFANYLTD